MKKETKTTKKVTKKAKKPEFVVDLTNIDKPLDVTYEFVQAKVRAGKPITQDEADVIEKEGFITAVDTVEMYIDEVDKHTRYIQDDKLANKIIKEINKAFEPKKPWYKRFWRWITFRK